MAAPLSGARLLWLVVSAALEDSRQGKELRGRHRLRCAGRCATLAGWSRTPAGDREDGAWELVGSPGSAVGCGPRRPTRVPAGRAAGPGMEKRSHACGSTGAVQLSRVTLLTPGASHPGCTGGGSALLVAGTSATVKWRTASLTGLKACCRLQALSCLALRMLP